MIPLAEFGRDALAFAVLLALPLGAAAVLGALASTLVGTLTGLQDPAVSCVLRVGAIAAAVVLMMPVALPEALALVREALAQLPVLGREGL